MNTWQFLKSEFGIKVGGKWNNGPGFFTFTAGCWWWVLCWLLFIFTLPLLLIGTLWWTITEFGPWAGLV